MDLPPYTLRLILGVIFSTFISRRGLKKKSLDPSGAASAWIAGIFTFLGGVRFAVVLVVFFYTSSWLTKYKGSEKKKIEDEYKEGGSRNWEQVFANAFTGTALSLLYIYFVGFQEIPLRFDHSWSSIILAAYIGHYACCNGDTWASELGVLSTYAPRLVTTFRVVPAGTNGGITPLGCLASTLGGLTIGAAFYATDVAIILFSGAKTPLPPALPVLLLGTVGGITGSLIDSLLGATVQYSGWSEARKKVVNAPGKDVKHLSGINIVNNHHVNFLSSLATAALAGMFAPLILSAL